MKRSPLIVFAVVFGIILILNRKYLQDRNTATNPAARSREVNSLSPTRVPSAPPFTQHTASSWVATGSLATPRSMPSATLLPSGKVLVVGGHPAAGREELFVSCELYDPEKGAWTTVEPFPSLDVAEATTLLSSGKVLVLSKTEAGLYDSETGHWTATGSHGFQYTPVNATLLQSGKVLVTEEFQGVDESSQIYDPTTGRWDTTERMSTKTSPVWFPHTATLLKSGKLLVVGPEGAQLYDPGMNRWTAISSPATARRNHTVTLLPSGKVLIVGGSPGDGNEALASAELYDPETGIWTTTGSLTSARRGQTATLLPSGKVLVAGGGGNVPRMASVLPMSSTELYDPERGCWTEGPALREVRAHHTATLLRSGKVLVVGGEGDLGVTLASAELYDPEASIKGNVVSASVSPPLPPTGAGRQEVYQMDEGAPFEIATRSDGFHYFVKLTDSKAGFFVLNVFIRSGEKVKLSIPFGNYDIKYAAGKTWYGERKLFGSGTIYAKANRSFEFTKGFQEVKGHRIELWTRPGGNLDITNISQEDF